MQVCLFSLVRVSDMAYCPVIIHINVKDNKIYVPLNLVCLCHMNSNSAVQWGYPMRARFYTHVMQIFDIVYHCKKCLYYL